MKTVTKQRKLRCTKLNANIAKTNFNHKKKDEFYNN